MPNKAQYLVYWDSNVFLSWLNGDKTRTPIIEGMREEVIEKREGKIVTSAFSITEVAHIAQEKDRRRRDATVDDVLNQMWRDPNILIVEASRYIMEMARELMRANLPYGGSLRGGDAIHLATAKFMENNGLLIQEIDTYDKWEKYAPLVGMTICEPHFDPKYEQTEMTFPSEELAEDDG